MSEWIYDPTAGRCRKTDGGKTMSDKIAEIRARHSRDDRWRNTLPQIHDDRAFLLAEDERHRAEIERLRKAMTNMMIGWRHIRREREEYRAEVERLRVEIERLKQEPELLRAELISLANAARKALADAYDRAKEVRDAFQQQGP